MIDTPRTLIFRMRDRGDVEARERFVTLFLPFLVTWSKQLVIQEDDAEDVIQNVFLTLFEKFATSSYDHNKPFRPWLFGMLRHKARERKKQGFVKKRKAVVLEQLPAREEAEPEFSTYERDLMQGALKVVQAQVEPATYRAFVMCKVEGKRATEVAKEVKKSVATVYQSVSRVMQRLREVLDGIVEL